MPQLDDRQIAMLELIEFGVDRWSSLEGRDMALDLAERGLLDVGPSPDDHLCCSITAEGSLALEVAKRGARASAEPMPARPRRAGRVV